MQMYRVGVGIAVIGILGACGGQTAASPSPEHPPAASSASSPSSAATPVKVSGSGSVAATVGAAGGVLELTEGPRVTIPPGTIVDQEREFVLQTATMTTAFLNNEGEQPAGPTFAFSPALEAGAAGPIQVSFPMPSVPEGWGEPGLAYEYGVGQRVGAEDSQHTQWQYESARHEDGRLVAKMNALVGMRLQFVLTNLEVQ